MKYRILNKFYIKIKNKSKYFFFFIETEIKHYMIYRVLF